ncbi:30S ribosomal protein S18 [Trichlorobacter lovleyi]|uniref:Small ribosomal subunit protein bS18 n=1 Tax=Trichlorobacter lovleyi (strain ATCC BAA-1151 / DSM 17278 / SZ) TaxID=398767 RepID=RS18_TRIL1|nr:30S ribosomal protein S18 [Trichlorobacter lovleyi]B3E6H4.1 RecName: Full=Small ribosomal subunit protein bS18; AltName: Full=30S ribosomal protein S18 [Trichlorobacter lovleyi SZ]ACD96321.1 ribosomal protein S18 [Trichlorobacter lovleyi SZ]QOX79577.1 30S ribosomal protein S18 [Trichlorobacter lovleyi]
MSEATTTTTTTSAPRPGGRPSGPRPDRGPGGPRKKRPFQRRKVCRFCAEKDTTIDYKDPRTLRYFITERGKIVPRRISGNCSKHQREITEAIKRARNLALLPLAAGHALP